MFEGGVDSDFRLLKAHKWLGPSFQRRLYIIAFVIAR